MPRPSARPIKSGSLRSQALCLLVCVYWGKIYHFKVYHSVVFNIFTTLCSHHHHLIADHSSPPKESPYPLPNSLFFPPYPPPPSNPLSIFEAFFYSRYFISRNMIWYNLEILYDISYHILSKRNYITMWAFVSGFFNIFKVYLNCSIYQYSIPFYGWIV